jgi:hypothetical protein
MPGIATSGVEVTDITGQGFRISLGTEQLPVPYEHFPWFRGATVEQLSRVERPTANHLYWPLLDIDLSVESLRHPEAFPLVDGLPG